ncbi:hypothetical protein Lser_V15G35958 [Lactuca serriola]|uniref:Uncharacterized protein n=1 Tax=Lactuca sativa TaxID=4236 RepID=A0A9R1UQC5_LACSA|nr:hypothetical protein LSAT_V11C800392630 [Lactuca sativa]
MFELTYELITVAASNPHFIFLFCNLIIAVLILVSLEPTSNSHYNCTATPIPPPPPPSAINENKIFETTTLTTQLQPTTTTDCNVSIDVNKLWNNCGLSVKDVDEEEHDDELRRRVEEFIDKINKGWKAEKLQLSIDH